MLFSQIVQVIVLLVATNTVKALGKHSLDFLSDIWIKQCHKSACHLKQIYNNSHFN